MSTRRLLLLSNSRNTGEAFLEHAEASINSFLGDGSKRVAFVPYAAVTVSWDDYAGHFCDRLRKMGREAYSVHKTDDPIAAVNDADVIVIGGGNTFLLAEQLHTTGLFETIRARIGQGVPYIGWSAGSNITCPTIRTTNDMPIVEPPTFDAFGVVPFQINPHYLDSHPEGHAGETRDERIEEFTELNPGVYVVGLREGSILRVEDSTVELLGDHSARVFIQGRPPAEYGPEESLSFLLKQAG